MEEIPNTASSVCNICKAGKRRCDRALPACTRCSRLGLSCQYINTNGTAAAQVLSGASLDTETVQRFFHSFQRDSNTVRITVDTYFETVNRWFPIVNEARYRRSLVAMPFPHDSDDLLLLLSLHLITQRPDAKPSMDDWLYRAVKQLCHELLARNAGPATLAMLQSAVLLATYEYGHDMLDAAGVTNGVCVSMAYTMGLNTLPLFRQRDEEVEWAPNEEESRVWWAVVINDRIFAVAKPPYRPPMTVIYNEEGIMSEIFRIERERHGHTLSVPLMQLYQQIQATIIMGQVLRLVTDSAPLSDSSQREFDRLDGQTQDVMKALFDPAAGRLVATCEALSMHRVSFMVLHQWQASLERSDRVSAVTARSLMAIKSGASITTSACEQFLPQTTAAQCTAHHPQTTQAVYHAARTAMQMGRSLFDENALESTLNMLTMQSTRWKIAATYLEILAAMGL